MKITIDTDQDLDVLKICYRNYYNLPKNAKVNKSDVANMLSVLVSADLQDYETEYDNEDY